MDITALLLSIISIVFSGLALIISFWRLKILRNKERDRKNDMKKANWKVIRTKTVGLQKMKDILHIENTGKAVARNIIIYINGKSINECKYVYSDVPTIAYIGPSSYYEITLSIYDQVQFPWEIKITWNDDYQTEREYITSVS